MFLILINPVFNFSLIKQILISSKNINNFSNQKFNKIYSNQKNSSNAKISPINFSFMISFLQNIMKLLNYRFNYFGIKPKLSYLIV